ncbi:hypothetical protein [Enterococcus mundtii]|uniref:hypothetical protein n=1 Tax=Enterococcus TaxID=1350 RepID=UPI0008F3C357|nr:hypothetical protein [Enterococcus mundtii]NBA63438.1 hypothetical protein [Enterococcus mundtii]SFM44156.1 hypothetical protein SAMN04487758_13410 [Enterococcus mundtii]STD22191.1 Uncharacterised protein [Enterococcus mundtii]
MKKIVTALLSTATIAGIMVTGTIAGAEQVVDGREGETSGDVTVRGIIGEFDNTTPGPNPEELDQWINVTIPTKALFYTTKASNHTTITSPEHTITNNSAVGVIASVSDVETPVNMKEVDLLSVNTVGAPNVTTIDLFEDGEPTITASELFRLQGNDGVNAGKFGFTGKATPVNASAELNPTFKLVLSFSPNVA